VQKNNYRLAPACLLTGMLLILPASAQPEVYKWVDQNGRTHYGEKPPARTQSKQLDIKPSSTPPNDGVSQQEHKNRRQKLLRAYEEERLQREDKRLKSRQDSAKRKRQCSSARNRQRVVEGGYRLFDYDEQGNRVFLDAKAIEKERAKSAREVKRFCR